MVYFALCEIVSPCLHGSQVLDDRACSAHTGRARDAASRVRPRAAQIQPEDRRSNTEAIFEYLTRQQLAVKYVSLGQTESALEVSRRENLPRLHCIWDIRRVLADGVDDVVSRSFSLRVGPRTVFARVREVLRENGEQVFAFRRESEVAWGLQEHFEDGLG